MSVQRSSHVSWHDWISCSLRLVQLWTGNLLMSTDVVHRMIASDVFLWIRTGTSDLPHRHFIHTPCMTILNDVSRIDQPRRSIHLSICTDLSKELGYQEARSFFGTTITLQLCGHEDFEFSFVWKLCHLQSVFCYWITSNLYSLVQSSGKLLQQKMLPKWNDEAFSVRACPCCLILILDYEFRMTTQSHEDLLSAHWWCYSTTCGHHASLCKIGYLTIMTCYHEL